MAYIYCEKGIISIDLSKDGRDVWPLLLENNRLKEAYYLAIKQNSS
jgi:hypothetical protein